MVNTRGGSVSILAVAAQKYAVDQYFKSAVPYLFCDIAAHYHHTGWQWVNLGQ